MSPRDQMISVQPTFDAFVEHFGGELISKLIPNLNPPRNADYLFRSPLVIAELECVERDAFTLNDIQRLTELANDWIRRRLIPPIFGTATLAMRELPGECQKEWLSMAQSPWKKKLEKANKQIKSMKGTLNLPDACGVLFLADESANPHDPLDVITLISRVLRSRKDDGTEIYSHVERIVYFSVNPRTVLPNGMGRNFWYPAYRHRNDPIVSEFLVSVSKSWFQYLGSIISSR